MTKLRFHILALYAASLVLAAFAWCAPAASAGAAPALHHHVQNAGHAEKSHVHETGAAQHGGHGSPGEAALPDCGMDETVCACDAVSGGVLPAVLTARDGGTETGLPAPLPAHPETFFAPQGPSPDAPPERRRRLTHSYDEIYGRTGRMLI